MVPIPEVSLPVRGAGREFRLTAWFRDTGGGDLVVFVHGVGCSKRSFAEAWRRRELRDWSLLAFDLPGFGRSPRPADYSYDLADQARLLQGLLDQHASRRIHLVAHSMGGTLALLLPPRVLARLASLVLVEPRLVAASCSVTREITALDFAHFEGEFLPQFRRRVAGDPRQAFDVDLADPLAFHRSSASLVHWAGSGEMAGRFLAAACPHWFVYGALNAHLAELQLLPPALTVAVAGAAHFPMQDNPDGFYAALGRLLRAPGC